MTTYFLDRDPSYSRQLDITLWTDHWAMLELVSEVQKRHFEGKQIKPIMRHLTVLLCNLYLCWCKDPELCLAIPMSPNEYRPSSRYNPLRVSKGIIEVVHTLNAVGLIELVPGFHDHRTQIGRLTRIWPGKELTIALKKLYEGLVKVSRSALAEPVVLRNEQSKEVEYDDTSETLRMRAELQAYNALLGQTFIDIPELEKPLIPLKNGTLLSINNADTFVHRVFNRSRWDKGGRFYGGWWQNCPKSWRKKIFMNDLPTIEDDYSGLHIVMLYGWEGIDYWSTVGPDEDPYLIEVRTAVQN